MVRTCPFPVRRKVDVRKVDVRLPGKGNSNSHGARPVHLIITMIKWIRTVDVDGEVGGFDVQVEGGVDRAMEVQKPRHLLQGSYLRLIAFVYHCGSEAGSYLRLTDFVYHCGSEAGSYLRLIDFVYHSTLGSYLRLID